MSAGAPPLPLTLASHTARPLRRLRPLAPERQRRVLRRLTRMGDILGLVASTLASRIPQVPR